MNYHLSEVIEPATSFALVSVDAAKDELKIPADDETKDGLIGRHIARVSAAINTYCGRVFVRQSYQDRFLYVNNWLRPGEPLMTRQSPIALDLVTHLPKIVITEKGVAVAATGYHINRTTGALYRLMDSGAVAWTGTDIIVDYDGGFDAIPEDVQGAALSWVTASWSARGRDPTLRSQMIPDVVTETYAVDSSLSATAATMPADVRGTLDAYRLWAV